MTLSADKFSAQSIWDYVDGKKRVAEAAERAEAATRRAEQEKLREAFEAREVAPDALDRIATLVRRAVDAGEREVMVMRFPSELMEQMRQSALAAGVKLKAAFEAALAREGIMGEWRQVEGTTPEILALHGRYADLLVLGQDDPESDSAGLLETVLFDSGRPVLAIPFAGSFKSIGKRVLVGWNASREATRALHDALPLIAKAENTTVFLANPKRGLGAHGEEPGADIGRHLARHGLKVEVTKAVAEDVADSALLLNHASDMGADLLVMGAYGHSRLREFILGGVTRSLLREMTVPVLLSH